MAGDEDDPAKIQILKDALYDAARENGSEARAFSQKDLLDFDIIPADNPMLLLRVVQRLCDDKLFVGITQATGLAWRWRNKEDAKKYTSLPNDETMMVYAVIDEAGADGIWNRTIKNKLNMHEAVVKTCIKYLETKGYISSMKNVEHPNKKMYIKANLRPSERATGGPWFTDGELDTAFISELTMIVFEYIKTQSAYRGSQAGGAGAAAAAGSGAGATKVPKKGVIRGGIDGGDSTSSSRGVKRTATDMSTDDIVQQQSKHPTAATKEKPKVFYPMPAGYKHYPTVTEIAKLIHETGITNNTTLGEADIQQLVDVLHYDGLIEPIRVNGRKGYRVTRAAKQDASSFQKRQQERQQAGGVGLPVGSDDLVGPPPTANGLTEAPCGRCPVFELCEEGGPVSPSNCVYFLQWLGLASSEENTNTLAGGATPNGVAGVAAVPGLVV
ncbi:DNA-directed RNA polymerase III-like protein [Apodospora peruviana]|uniref:DNA-directed RNA polymerase III-like protein n=1 Tax=Apodospora peruviana TaxID=516989 RepID=A0AAE0MFM5_9PEZI|nr:DNA-directed RNA polymerase III-like protein [Apodospora peruviana]